MLEILAEYSGSVFAWTWSPTQVLRNDVNFGNAVIAAFIAFVAGETCFAFGRFTLKVKLFRLPGSPKFDEIIVFSDDDAVGENTQTVVRQAVNLIELFSALFFCSSIWLIGGVLQALQTGPNWSILAACLGCAASFFFARMNEARAYWILLYSDGMRKGIFSLTKTRDDSMNSGESE